MKTTAIRSLLAVLALAALVSTAASQPAPGDSMRTVLGPVYSAARLRSTPLLGVTLRMPMAKAEKILVAQGFGKRFDEASPPDEYGLTSDGGASFFGKDGFVIVDYVFLGRQKIVSRVSYYVTRFAADDPKTPEEWRRRLVARFGEPSRWLQWISNGKIADRMLFVTKPALRDEEYATDRVLSCTASWECYEAREGIDCRKLIEAARVPVLSLAFDAAAIHYELRDHDLDYRSLMRAKAFRDQDASKAVCLIPTIH